MADSSKWRRAGEGIKQAASFSTVGLEMGLSVALGYFLGDRLDGYLGCGPFGMIGGVLLGTAAGFLSLYRALKRAHKDGDG